MLIQAFNGKKYCCVNDKDIHALEIVPERESKSQEFDIDYQKPAPEKQYIPPMNHPWRHQKFGAFVKKQKHSGKGDSTKFGANVSQFLGHFHLCLTEVLLLRAGK